MINIFTNFVSFPEHRLTRGEVVLKAINCNLVTADEFYRYVFAGKVN
jgi:hypothetical protein